MKKKTYCYENRTFEVEVYSELCGSMLMIYIDEVIRPNRKFLVALSIFMQTMLSLTSILLLMTLLKRLSRRAWK